MQSADLGRHPG